MSDNIHNTRSRGGSTYSIKQSPTKKSSTSNDTPLRSQPTESVQPGPREFLSDDSELIEIDVVGEGDPETEQDIVLPGMTTSGEKIFASINNEQTPTKRAGNQNCSPIEEEGDDDIPSESIFSSFPCNVIPETLLRMTKTPVDGEHLEVRKYPNGRLRIFLKDQFKKFSPYSNMTHRPCIVCQRTMKNGEMHLNFPSDLDRRRIWANLLGFKYKDILRSKIGPVSVSIAGGPICTEHFSEECFRNHNFNKAAIEAFGVPVAISPDVKTTPSKKRVPWVCTICEFNSCSVVELQEHLLRHTEEMQKDKVSLIEVPNAGFMCPFCRKCTYGYRTIGGFRRHLHLAPINHCHLRRIYEFAKINCRSSELEPTDSWENWTRRNVYVAYHGCEPPIDEIILTPSPTKSILSAEEKSRKNEQDIARRKKAIRSLSFVGKEGGTSVNDHNVMQRAAVLQMKRMQDKSASPEVEIDAAASAAVATILPQGKVEEKKVKTEVIESAKSSKNKPTSQSVGSSPVKKTIPTNSKGTSCPVSPTKTKQRATRGTKRKGQAEIDEEDDDNNGGGGGGEEEEEGYEKEEMEEEEDNTSPRKKIDDVAFARMVEKRARAVKRLISAKLPNQPKKPRKAFGAFTMTKIVSSSSTSSNESNNGKNDSSPSTKSSQEINTKKDETDDERPLKSVLARSFAEDLGKRSSMAKYYLPFEKDQMNELFKSEKSSSIIRLAGGSGTVRPNVLGGRRSVKSSPKVGQKMKNAQNVVSHESGGTTEQTAIKMEKSGNLKNVEGSDETELRNKEKEISPNDQPKTLADILALKTSKEFDASKSAEEFDETIANEFLNQKEFFDTVVDAVNTQKMTKVKQDLKMSKHCMRQLEAARARARLFGERSEERFDIVHTSDGPQLVTQNDPEWKLRQNQQY